MNNLTLLSDIENIPFQSTHMKREAITLEELNKILNPVYYQRKYNGCYTLLILDDTGNVEAYNKKMAKVPNLEYAKAEAKLKLSASRVYLCEAVVFNSEGIEDFEEASRVFNPNNNVTTSKDIKLVIFDSVTLDEFIKGKSEVPFMERWGEIEEQLYIHELSNIDLAETSYLKPSFITESYYKNCLTRGDEGAIITFDSSIWDRRTMCYTSFKLIPVPTIDLKIVGYVMGKGKHTGIVGTVLYEYKVNLTGKRITIPVDGSLTLFDRKDIVTNFDKYEGKISKISYKGFTRFGKLRQPKIMELVRHDKFISDIE